MTEAVLNSWLKQPGDMVEEGDSIAEIETDKTTMELEAPCAGRLGPHLVSEGDVVEVGVTVVQVLQDDAPSSSAADGPASLQPDQLTGAGRPSSEQTPASAVPSPPAAVPEAAPLSRRAIALAQAAAEAGAADTASSTAPPAALPTQANTPATPPGAANSPTWAKFRNLIAERVSEAWRTIPHFTVTREIPADILKSRLGQLRSEIPSLTLTDLMVAALARALASTGVPAPVDVGLAVASEHGVMIPVLADVTSLSLAGVAEQRAHVVERGRSGRLGTQDLRTPTCTLSNLGAYGVDQFTGIIATGQSSLLTVGRIAPRVVAAAGGVAVRDTFYATVNADHRKFDGADAARLLAAFVDACGSFDATLQEA